MDRSDNHRDLNAVSNRLAAQTDHLQGHLQQQLNLNSSGQVRNMFASRPAGLASLGEDAEATSDAPHSSQSQSTYSRQAGPRFAGNAAFQSAMARHSNQSGNAVPPSSSADFRANLSHQRQLSLQSRFADLGYNFASGLGPTPSEADDITDDGASSIGYGASSFDPTRGQRGHVSDFSFSSSGTASHRRTGSDMSGMLSNRGHQPAASVGDNPNSLSAQSQMFAEQQIALQQQIEMLQLQQQQLMQSAGLPQQPHASAPNPLNGGNLSFGGHRRIQSHAPRSGPMGSFSTGNPFHIGGLSNFVPSQPTTQTSNLPRG
ncbi:hypothetical protein [Sporisorium scitamineum]|nr:hypothetical protein [Sporisorium scitamineum]